MADEQIIYLSPEEDLTSVRERLEGVQAQRIILVIPAQTQLRSHTSWRLLYARARELHKDILIISTDRQIRSVVKATGFSVADSLESPSSGKSRSSSRLGRTGLGGRPSAHLRTSPRTSGSGRRVSDTNADLDKTQQFANRPPKPLDGDSTSSQRRGTRGSMTPPASATFGADDHPFEPEIQYNITNSPTSNTLNAPIMHTILPSAPSYQDEEPNLYDEDIKQAQIIRQAALENDSESMMPHHALNAVPSTATPQIIDLPISARGEDDPLYYHDDDDDDAVSLPEQRGSISFDELDERGTDITHATTNVIHVEDEGDLGDFAHDSGSQPYPWARDNPDEDVPGPSRVHNVRPRASRTGKMPVEPLIEENNDDQTPLYERPTQDFPSPLAARQTATPAAGGSTGTRSPQPMPLAQPRPVATKSVKPVQPVRPPSKKRPETGRKSATTRTIGKTPVAARQTRNQQNKQSRTGGAIVALLCVLILLIIGLVAFLWPSADVTITLPSHDYPLQMKLTANATSRQDTTLKTLPAQTLVFDTSVTGTGHATGSVTVGTIQATGNVTFTNSTTTSGSSIVIPTGTIIATKNGIQFVTQAEALVQSNSTILVPIKAQNTGANGNVPAGSITVIPPASTVSIQQANPGVVISLSVNNTDPTIGGGAGSATSLTNADVSTEKAALDLKLQTQIKDYLAKNVLPDDHIGKPIRVETPVASPTVGSVVSNDTFTETLKLHMTVLVVRAADLQAAATAQLQDVLARTKSTLALVPQQPVQFKQVKNTSPIDGKSVALGLTAIGQVAPQISADIVRSLIYGKSVEDAQQNLVGKNGIPMAIRAQITVSPGFFHWVPFWSQHINVHFKAVPQPITPPVKPKHR